jgi:hypothetical protein
MDEFFGKGLKYVFIKATQRDLEKCIIWSKKLEKDKQKLKRVNFGILKGN